MSQKMQELFQRWFRTDGHVRSSIFVKVELLNVMRPRRLSKRVILKASLWTVLLIMFAFIICYTILLTYFDRRVWLSDKSASRSRQTVQKVRLNQENKFVLETPGKIFSSLKNPDKNRKILWKPENYYDLFASTVGCNTNSLFTIIITSSPNHFDQRFHIRKTWCNPLASGNLRDAWQCVFLIGQTFDTNTDDAVDWEGDRYHDILRGTYVDSYRNLTRKVIHGMNWSSLQCPTQYTVKTDDDCFVNAKLLYDFLLKYNTKTSGLYVGKINRQLNKRKVIRTEGNRWAVSERDFSGDYYPPYASGTGYVMSRDVVQSIADESRFIQPIPNEDAYVGIVINSLGVKPTMSSRFTVFSVGLRVCNFLYVFIVHSVEPQGHELLLNNTKQAHRQCKDADTTTWT